MVATAPHFLLLTETQSCTDEFLTGGFWRFVLQQIDGSGRLEVSDTEPGVMGERLQLLAVIRGLEALEQPSRVTLVTSSRYVTRGIRRGLDSWRESNWTWERFGELHDIKHREMWQRVDRALQFHMVQCRAWRVETKTASASAAMGKRQSSRKAGKRVLEAWVQAAKKFGARNTAESLVSHVG